MSNKKKTNEAEQRAQVAQQQAESAAKNVKITPEAQNVLTTANNDFNAAHSGDVRNIGAVANFLAQSAAANKTASRVSPTGSAALATDVANPTLIAMNQDKLNREQAQQQGFGVTQLAMDAEDTAAQRIGAISGMDLSAKSNLAGFMFQNSANAWDRYKFEKSQKPFWQQFALGAVGAAGQAAGAYFGKP